MDNGRNMLDNFSLLLNIAGCRYRMKHNLFYKVPISGYRGKTKTDFGQFESGLTRCARLSVDGEPVTKRNPSMLRTFNF